MVFHLAAFYESVPAGASDYEMDVVPDDVLTRTGDERFAIPGDLPRLAFAVKSKDDRDMLIYTPSLEVRRINKYIRPTLWEYGMVDETVVSLVPTEELSVITENPDTADEVQAVIVALGEVEPADISDALLVKATATADLTAGVWNTVKVTPEVQLEAGSYQLVGCVPYIGVSGAFMAVRFLFSGQVYRPGLLAMNVDSEVYPNLSLAGRGINFGTFTHLTFPEIQVFTDTAATGASVELWMYLRKTA